MGFCLADAAPGARIETKGRQAGTPVLQVRVWDVHSQKPAKFNSRCSRVGSPLASPRLGDAMNRRDSTSLIRDHWILVSQSAAGLKLNLLRGRWTFEGFHEDLFPFAARSWSGKMKKTLVSLFLQSCSVLRG